jgi:hypothetical protein
MRLLTRHPLMLPHLPSSEIDEMRGLLAEEIAFYKSCEALYQTRIAQMPTGFSERVERHRREKQEYLLRRKASTHRWSRYYA